MLRVLRRVERNPFKALLVTINERWRYSTPAHCTSGSVNERNASFGRSGIFLTGCRFPPEAPANTPNRIRRKHFESGNWNGDFARWRHGEFLLHR